MSRKNPRFRRINPTLPVAAANLFQISMIGSLEGQLTVNNFYYQDGGQVLAGGGSPTELELVTAFHTGVFAYLRACISSDWTLTGYRVAVLTTPSRIPYFNLPTQNNTATGAAGHEPTTISSLFSRYSGVRGQSGRGRVYIPAVPTVIVVASQIATASFGAFQSAASQMSAPQVATSRTYTPGVVSRRGVAQGGANYGFSPLTSCVARQLLASTRRRRIGRGK